MRTLAKRLKPPLSLILDLRLVICAILASVGTQVTTAEETTFEDRLVFLREQRAYEVGIQPIVEGYERLIADFPDEPRIAEAMMDVGSLLLLVIPDLDIKRDRARALKWYRNAAENAVPGSKLWSEARLMVARRLHAEPDEARRIFDEVADHAQDDSALLARVEHDLMNLSLMQGDLEGAETHCERVLNWYDDPSRVPEKPTEKMALDGYIRSAGSAMVTAFGGAPWPKEQRRQRIRSFMEKYFWVGGVKNSGEQALDYVDSQPGLQRSPTPVAKSTLTRSRLVLIVVNIAVIVVVRGVVPWRRKR